MKQRLIIGAMSGTSADGVDAALVRFHGTCPGIRASYLHHVEQPYPVSLQHAIRDTRDAGSVGLDVLARLAREIALAYAEAVANLLDAAGARADEVSAIAAHGQTLFHRPPATLQWIDAALLAQQSGIAVITDFRRADCAAGGQGAPLVPFADHMLFHAEGEDRVILNLGGIANVTLLPAGGSVEDVSGFDTGPGNCVSDFLMRQWGGVDVDGQGALNGTPSDEAVAWLMRQAYFDQPPPKSTDGPQMIEMWRACPLVRSLSLHDQLATAARWTALAVSRAVSRTVPAPTRLIIAGGGVKNRAMMNELRAQLPRSPICTTDELGIPAQAREAVAFAVLGAAHLDRVPANLPRVTGAGLRVVLGAMYPQGGAGEAPARQA